MTQSSSLSPLHVLNMIHALSQRRLLLPALAGVLAVYMLRVWYPAFARRRRLRRAIVQRQRKRDKGIEVVAERLQATPAKLAIHKSLHTRTVQIEVRTRIRQLPITDIASSIRSGTFTALDVLHAYQEAAVEAHYRTNCVCEFVLEAEQWAKALDSPDIDVTNKPLLGVPFSVKESNALKGYDVTRGYAQALGQVCTEDAVFIKVLKDLGAIPFVRCNLPQTLLSYTCANPIYGRTTHPLCADRSPGGSSGGDAALLACSGALFAIGGDVGGSIRMPCHFCGVAGLKPSKSRICQKGCFGSVPGRPLTSASFGPMAPSVDTLSMLMQFWVDSPDMHKADPYVPLIPWTPVKQGTSFFQPVPACQRAVRLAFEALSSRGHTMVPFKPPDVALGFGLFLASATVDGGEYVMNQVNNDIPEPDHAEFYALMSVPAWLRQFVVKNVMPRLFKRMHQAFKHMPSTSAELRKVYEQIENYRRAWADYWRSLNIDVLICPANVSVAMPPLMPMKVPAGACYTAIFNTLDYPAGVVPCTTVTQHDIRTCQQVYPETDRWYRLIKQINTTADCEGLPVGVQCVSLPFQEEICLFAMQEIENALETKAKELY